MTERTSRWTEPGSIAAVIAAVVTVFSLVWAAATITKASTDLASDFDHFKRDMIVQISAVQAQIASLPTQGVRLDNVERVQREIRAENAAQNGDINAVKQAVAVLSNTMDGLRHDLDALQSAANGRLPGGRR